MSILAEFNLLLGIVIGILITTGIVLLWRSAERQELHDQLRWCQNDLARANRLIGLYRHSERACREALNKMKETKT